MIEIDLKIYEGTGVVKAGSATQMDIKIMVADFFEDLDQVVPEEGIEPTRAFRSTGF